MLTRDEIAAKQDLRSEMVHIPEWGGEVEVRELPAGISQKFWDGLRAEHQGGGVPEFFRERLIIQSVVDGNGDRLFSEDDVEMLAGKCNAAVNAIFDVAVRLSGISDTEIEDAVKN